MKNLLNRVMALILIAVMTYSMTGQAYGDTTYPTTVETTAEGYIIYDVTDGKMILGQNEDQQYYPASITKIMTALLVVENIEDLDRELTFSQEALDEMTSDSSTLSPAAVVGEKMSVRDAMFGMFMVSSNGCAAQLGIEVAGSTEKFAEMMNERAKEIGCKNTHFVNAHGLHDENHYTTPEDMALIFGEALKNPVFLEMATTYEYDIEPTNKCTETRELKTSHSIVNGTLPYPEVFAGKTGRTPVAGRTLCTAAQFDGHIVVVVIMKSNDDDFYNDTLRLLDYARGYYDGAYTDMTWEEKREKVYVYGTNSLKVRAYPSTAGAKVIGTLQYGQSVNRVATWGEWSMIEYMDANYFVYSAYLTDEQPEEEYDPGEAITEATRETVVVVIPTTTEEEETTASQEETYATMGEQESYTRIPGDTDDDSDAIKSGSHGSIVRVIFYVCIALMVIIAVVFTVINIRERNKRKRRRRRINTDEWYK